jgi:diguanylate cyclase (GGDEF)-like protein
MTSESKILLIGTPKDAFLETQADNLPIQVCPGILDGIEAVIKQQYTTVAVVMADTATNLRTGLATLRKNTNAKILLLARMFEEPAARELIDSNGNGSALADDYIICPIRPDKFRQAVNPPSAEPVSAQVSPPSADMQARIRRLEKLATEDDLTGLKNRRYILEFARQIIETAKRDNRRVTVLIFDIDNLKHYNDVYGHAAGDEVLKQTATLIHRCCRRHDVVGRLGGDEFAVVFWDDARGFASKGDERRTLSAEHPREAILIARRFRTELEKEEFRLLGPEGKGVLTISGGLASLGSDGSTAQELFTKADYALLDAKRSGKNRVYLMGSTSSPQAGPTENDIDKIE